MLKVVYYASHGGFCVPALIRNDIIDWFRDHNLELPVNLSDIPRHHPALVESIEKYKRKEFCEDLDDFEIATIDSDRYYITECDGLEEVIAPDSHTPWIIVDEEERKRCLME